MRRGVEDGHRTKSTVRRNRDGCGGQAEQTAQRCTYEACSMQYSTRRYLGVDTYSVHVQVPRCISSSTSAAALEQQHVTAPFLLTRTHEVWFLALAQAAASKSNVKRSRGRGARASDYCQSAVSGRRPLSEMGDVRLRCTR